ncbi:MAG: OFA family MFS transporter [Oscillospiraceae bacterium]|nr:OFA family MFS transporter [Oscillospiraceae bacterium]
MSAETNRTAPAGSRQGLLTVGAAIAIQLTLGVAYIWSVFQTGIANSIFGGNNAAAALTFSILLATLTIGSVIGGKLAAKFSTRIVVFTGGIILSAGFFLAAFVTADFSWLLWLTYGAMGGVGMGFTYSTTIACAQKWYPHKKGLVTGIIVSALGFGGVIFTPIVEKLIDVFGGTETGEQKTFMVLGGVFLVVCSLCSFFLKSPHGKDKPVPAANAAAQKSYTTTEMLKSPKFYLTVFTYLLACMGGLMMIGFAKPIAVAKDLAETATVGVLAISMFNSAGRLLWGMVSDKLGRVNTILILLTGSAVLSLLVNLAEGYLIFVLIAFIGFFYGGIIGTFPSLTNDLFGPKFMATNYGVVLLGFGAGAIIQSQIVGHFKNVADNSGNIGDILPAFIIASCCAAAGIVMMLILKKINKINKPEVI